MPSELVTRHSDDSLGDSCRPTALVIRALGLLVGKLIRDDRDISDVCDVSDIRNKNYMFLTQLITQVAHGIMEHQEIDINYETVTSRRIGNVLKKMRFNKRRQGGTGKNGWIVSLEDVIRWAVSYGLDPSIITGLNIASHPANITDVTNITNITPMPATPFRGVL